MSAQGLIDNLQFARTGEMREADVPLAALSRLVGEAYEPSGTLHYRLEGIVEQGRPCLKLVVQGALRLICQRCMQPFAWQIENESLVCVARNQAELDRWELLGEETHAMLDAILADPRMDLLQFVEDEILLSLPIIPRHSEECEVDVVSTKVLVKE